MNTNTIFFSLLFFILSLTITPVFSSEGNLDGTTSIESANITTDHKPTLVFDNASHVANGVALRNRTSGWIHLRGVPLGSTVVKAYLYFNLSDSKVTASSWHVLFNGNRVRGAKVADNVDPCWGMAGNHTFRADVTRYIPANRPNEDYEVVPTFKGGSQTSGEHPWSSSGGSVLLNGATLIVVYENDNTIGKTVNIYDALSGTEFSSSATFNLAHSSLSGLGLFTMSGADGQRGSGHDNTASNEIGTLNGTQFSGPPVAASDWDGSAGWPLPQLWDVHTHNVRLTGSTSTVSYTAGSDCLVPVVFIIEGS